MNLDADGSDANRKCMSGSPDPDPLHTAQIAHRQLQCYMWGVTLGTVHCSVGTILMHTAHPVQQRSKCGVQSLMGECTPVTNAMLRVAPLYPPPTPWPHIPSWFWTPLRSKVEATFVTLYHFTTSPLPHQWRNSYFVKPDGHYLYKKLLLSVKICLQHILISFKWPCQDSGCCKELSCKPLAAAGPPPVPPDACDANFQSFFDFSKSPVLGVLGVPSRGESEWETCDQK